MSENEDDMTEVEINLDEPEEEIEEVEIRHEPHVLFVPHCYEATWSVLTYKFLSKHFIKLPTVEFYRYRKYQREKKHVIKRCKQLLNDVDIVFYENLTLDYSEELDGDKIVCGIVHMSYQEPLEPARSKKDRIERLAREKQALERADPVFLTSSHLASFLNEYKEKSVIVGLPIDFDYFSSFKNEKFRKFTVIWNHRLKKSKGTKLLLEFLPDFLPNHENINFIITFQLPPHTNYLGELNRMKKKFSKLSLKYGLPLEPYLHLLSRCHLGFSTSLYDFFGTSIAYGIAVGTPFIVLDKKLGHKDFLPEQAYYKDLDTLSEKIVNYEQNHRSLNELLTSEREGIRKYDVNHFVSVIKKSLPNLIL